MLTTRPVLIALALSAAAVGAATALFYSAEPLSHDQRLGKASLTIRDADAQLKGTRVVATLDAPHSLGTSLLWCGTAQLAWDELGSALNGKKGPVRVEGGHALADSLNKGLVSPGDFDPASYVAHAGFGRDGILDTIKASLKAKFDGKASPALLPSSVPDADIFAYAYLFKNLEFPTPFMRRKVPLEIAAAKLKSFGLWSDPDLRNWSELARQITILGYESDDRWTVELKTKDSADRFIIARLPPAETLAETLNTALAWGDSSEPILFEKADTFIVPLMNFDITHTFRELIGMSVSGDCAAGVINDAKQNIRLRLDEKGAILKSEFVMGVTSAAPRRDKPKRLVCDGPFLIAFMRDGAKAPYFALWVENPELLEAWK